MNCGIKEAIDSEKTANSANQDELDRQVADAGKLKVINEIDPELWKVSDVNLRKFLSYFDHTYTDRNKPKGPDYLIMDNFFTNFDLN